MLVEGGISGTVKDTTLAGSACGGVADLCCCDGGEVGSSSLGVVLPLRPANDSLEGFLDTLAASPPCCCPLGAGEGRLKMEAACEAAIRDEARELIREPPRELGRDLRDFEEMRLRAVSCELGGVGISSTG